VGLVAFKFLNCEQRFCSLFKFKMSDVPPPPKLTRQHAVEIARPWVHQHDLAMMYWKNAKAVFPDMFEGSPIMTCARVTPSELELIHQASNPGSASRDTTYLCNNYKLGTYVGKFAFYPDNAILDIVPEFTYYTHFGFQYPDTAMYEASLLLQDFVKSGLRHILYSLYSIHEFDPKTLQETILHYGRYYPDGREVELPHRLGE
jgi:hypothetical protein